MLARVNFGAQLTYDKAERVDVRSFGHAVCGLPFRAAPHGIAYNMRGVERLYGVALEDEVKVAQSCITDDLLACFVVLPIDQDVVRFNICQVTGISWFV